MIGHIPLNQVHKAAKKMLPKSRASITRTQKTKNLIEKASALGALGLI